METDEIYSDADHEAIWMCGMGDERVYEWDESWCGCGVSGGWLGELWLWLCLVFLMMLRPPRASHLPYATLIRAPRLQ